MLFFSLFEFTYICLLQSTSTLANLRDPREGEAIDILDAIVWEFERDDGAAGGGVLAFVASAFWLYVCVSSKTCLGSICNSFSIAFAPDSCMMFRLFVLQIQGILLLDA